MAVLKEIEKNLETVSIIKNIAGTYHEIANLRMNQIREKVLKTRYFFNELLNTYQRIKSAYLVSLKKKKNKEFFFRQTEKDEVVIFLSANEFFYGSLLLDIWKDTERYLTRKKADLVIVGRTGKYLAERSGWGQKMFYFELNDVEPEKERIEGIFEFIKNYKKIVVFHGIYEKILSQKPKITEISSWILPKKETEKEEKTYLFEPSVEEILGFFETEILAILFSQTIFEHQLAKFAARVIAMYQASEKSKEIEKFLNLMKNKLERDKINKEQVEYFGGLKFLKK